MEPKHIAVIGGGFAGLRIARLLNDHEAYRVTLIDRNNYHQFQPLLYQVATANLDASNISFPLRNIFQRSRNVRIRIAEVQQVDPVNKTVHTSTGDIRYDMLVVATGADTNYFGNAQMQQYAFPMKSTLEALQLRNQLIRNFEDAVLATDPAVAEQLLTIVVVGGGPTGIELSGALAEIKKEMLPKEYPELDFTKMQIILLEGSDKVLGNMSKAASDKACAYLKDMGVIVKTNTLVQGYDGSQVQLKDGSTIPSALVIWAAGIKGSVPAGIDASVIVPGNRIKVDAYNRVAGFDQLYAIGDIAFMPSEKYPKGHPQLASVAIDQATNLAENFKNMAQGKALKPYHYHNKGTMATVGRNKAVVDLETPRISFQGYLAWVVWMTVHLFLLIGFKNRIVVFINWVYKYFTRNQSLSLFFGNLLRKRV